MTRSEHLKLQTDISQGASTKISGAQKVLSLVKIPVAKLRKMLVSEVTGAKMFGLFKSLLNSEWVGGFFLSLLDICSETIGLPAFLQRCRAHFGITHRIVPLSILLRHWLQQKQHPKILRQLAKIYTINSFKCDIGLPHKLSGIGQLH